jgi:Flp pilus assembly protein TadG
MIRSVDRLRDESGQVLVFVVALLVILIGMAALVIDGGSWLRAQRHLQTAADAGALAGAQDLPNTGGASANAISYAQTNYTGIPDPTVTFPVDSSCGVNSCINVAAETTAPGFLAKIYGSVFSNVTIRAHARAGLSIPSSLKNVAPVAVKTTLACRATTVPSCFNVQKTLSFNESDVSSSTIGLIDLTCHGPTSSACSSTAGIGGSTLKDWIENGFSAALPSSQWYGVKTGETVGPVKQGFTNRIGIPLFFPVFDQVTNIGSSYFFHIVGWSAFVIDEVVQWGPGGRTLKGHFVTFIATDLAAGGPISGADDYGVHVITLIQ